MSQTQVFSIRILAEVAIVAALAMALSSSRSKSPGLKSA
jgi:thiamine transporter ThiT